MARNKKFYLKDAKENFEQGSKMLIDIEADSANIQAIRNAARQAQEAATQLWMLAGILENEIPSGNREPSKGLQSEIDRHRNKS